MVLKHLLLSLLLVLSGIGSPATAHREHPQPTEQQTNQQEHQGHPAPEIAHPGKVQTPPAAVADVPAERPFLNRILDWSGRLHPFMVHFPLALFPVSWIALILGRRRNEAEPLLRSLIIVAGASAALAAFLGWLGAEAVLADADPLMLWHRWLGTGLGIIGGAVALWSWRHRSAAHSKRMVAVLGAVTFLLLAQGWLGGALVHGADHLNW